MRPAAVCTIRAGGLQNGPPWRVFLKTTEVGGIVHCFRCHLKYQSSPVHLASPKPVATSPRMNPLTLAVLIIESAGECGSRLTRCESPSVANFAIFGSSYSYSTVSSTAFHLSTFRSTGDFPLTTLIFLRPHFIDAPPRLTHLDGPCWYGSLQGPHHLPTFSQFLGSVDPRVQHILQQNNITPAHSG